MNFNEVTTTLNNKAIIPASRLMAPKKTNVPVGGYLLFLGLAGAAIVGTTYLARKNPGFKGKVLNRTLGFVVPFVLRKIHKSVVTKWSTNPA